MICILLFSGAFNLRSGISFFVGEHDSQRTGKGKNPRKKGRRTPPREVRLGTFVTPILILPSPQASLFRAAFVFWVTWSEQAVRLGFVAEIHWTGRA